jgi:Mrp family chromosome partitioning ATPase
LEDLESTAQTYRKLYESFLEVLTDSIQRQSAPVSDSRVITRATRPLFRAQPQTKQSLLIGFVAGAALFFAVKAGRFLAEGRIWSSQQLREHTGMECLGVLPRRELPVPALARLPFRAAAEPDGTPPELDRNRVDRIRIAMALAGTKPVRSVGIIPVGPDRLQVPITTALARAHARAGARVLIISTEVDEHEREQIGAAREKLGSGQDPCRYVHLTSVSGHGTGIDRLPAAALYKPSDMDVVDPIRLQAALGATHERYDIVFVDLPPVQVQLTALEIGPALDGLIFVAECGRTGLRELADSARVLEAASARIFGTVLTQADPWDRVV